MLDRSPTSAVVRAQTGPPGEKARSPRNIREVRALGVMGEAAHPDDGRFIGKPYGAAELFTEVDDLMRKS
jgi:hypothetical protein